LRRGNCLLLILDFIQFGKHLDGKARVADVLGDFLHGRKANIRNLLFADLQVLGDVAVGPPASE
jgi:hypothetical protein